MKRCTMVLVATALVAALAMAGSAQAVTVDWVGGTGTWWLENSWSVDGGAAVTAQTALGDRDGWDFNDAGAPDNPDIVIGAGGDVWYDVFDATVIPVENSDWRMVQRAPTNGGSLTVSGGGKFTLNSSEDQDGEWSTFDADSLTVTGSGSLLKKTYNSTDPRANTPGLSNAGGAFIFGSYRGFDGQAISINVADGGQFEVNGQLHFGWWDRISEGGDEGELDITMTISDQSHVALTGGDNVDLLGGAAGGFGQNDLVMNRNWDDNTSAPANGTYIIDFLGHGGSLSVDHSGISMPVQIGPSDVEYDFDTLGDFGTGAPALLSYQDLYNGLDRGDPGPSITDVPAGTLRANGSFAAAFGNVFSVQGESGEDGYKVTSIVGAVQGGAYQSDINGDLFVDGADAGRLIAGFGLGTDLVDGNINGDGFTDGADAGLLTGDFGNEYDPGPAQGDAGDAIAEYNVVTGRIIVSVDQVSNWYIDADMSGPDSVGDVLPIEAGGLVTDNAIRVGEWVPGGNFTYTNVDLGMIAAAGLDNVRIWYNGPGFGTPLVEGTMSVVPEPASIALIGFSLCGVLALRRRLVA